jgi:FkbM family methyltransferase
MQKKFSYKKLDKIIYKLRKLYFRPYNRQITISKYSFKVFITNPEADLWYGTFKYEFAVWPQLEFDVIIRNVQPGDIVFDIGCHHGVWLLLFSNLVGTTGKVFGFDTSKSNSEIALKNIKLNEVLNASVENICVSDIDGVVQVDLDSSGVSKYSIQKQSATVDLESIKLDTYCERISTFPTVVKIDVEGYEREVLRGAAKILQRNPKIFIELHNFKFAGQEQKYIREVFELIPNLKFYSVCFQALNGGDIEYYPRWDSDLVERLSKFPNPHVYLY